MRMSLIRVIIKRCTVASYTLNRGNKYESVIYVGLNIVKMMETRLPPLFIRFVLPGMEEKILDGII